MTTKLSKTDERLQAIHFLSKSMLPEDGRFHVGHIRVEADGSAVSTDGARLHFVKDINLEPGYYKVYKCTKSGALIDKVFELDTSEGGFPDYADILTIPKAVGFDVMLGASDNIPSKVFTKVVRAMAKSTVNFNFINDLCNVFNDLFSVIVPEPDTMSNNDNYIQDEPETCKPIHFVNNGYHAVIMPVRIV